MTTEILQRIERALEERFGTAIPVAAGQPGSESLARLLEHHSHRKYAAQPVSAELLRLLFACALSSPSKSDLQQADIVHVGDALAFPHDATIHDSPITNHQLPITAFNSLCSTGASRDRSPRA